MKRFSKGKQGKAPQFWIIANGRIRDPQVRVIDDENKIALVSFKESKYHPLLVNEVVVALGTERPLNYLNSIGIDTVTESNEFFSESKMPGLFFVGDLAASKSGGSINFAFNSGVKAVTQACDMYLDCPLPNTKKST